MADELIPTTPTDARIFWRERMAFWETEAIAAENKGDYRTAAKAFHHSLSCASLALHLTDSMEWRNAADKSIKLEWKNVSEAVLG